MQNLKHLQGKLKLIEVHRPGIENGIAQSCENCGRTILNFAKVEHDGKKYTIGTECAKTLCDKDGAKDAKGYEIWRERIEFFTKQPFDFRFERHDVNEDYINVLAFMVRPRVSMEKKWYLIDTLRDKKQTFPKIMLHENQGH